MNINKKIHVARGLCWHEEKYIVHARLNIVRCSNCAEAVQIDNPDYTDPVHYCALMDWMGQIYRSVKFDTFLVETKGLSDIYFWLRHSRQEQITLIAEAIEAGVLK